MIKSRVVYEHREWKQMSEGHMISFCQSLLTAAVGQGRNVDQHFHI